jgi:hypothetical protein
MKVTNTRISFFMLALIILTLACGLPSATSTESTPSDTTEAPATESAPPTEFAIQHTTIPVNLPSEQSGEAADFDSSKVLTNGTLVGGDRYTYGRFERPFNADTMDVYFSQLDIVNTEVFQDETWIYASIVMKELTASSSANEKYAVEIDSNLNGKGDWLIIGLKPVSTDWTVNGVQIFQDANKDVGLELPTLTDQEAIGTSDGFETKVFDQGQGNDPDSAWIRISPNNPSIIEFAIKQSAIESPQKYLINMWAGTGLLDPANFDINDKFTHEQAGAADAGLQVYYPIKAVAEIDSSCRMAVGFQPTGEEAGLCEIFRPQVENPPLGCQATDREIFACNSDPYGTWNAGTCSCDYNIPG